MTSEQQPVTPGDATDPATDEKHPTAVESSAEVADIVSETYARMARPGR